MHHGSLWQWEPVRHCQACCKHSCSTRTDLLCSGVCVQVLTHFPYSSLWLNNLAYCFWVRHPTICIGLLRTNKGQISTISIFLFFIALSVTRMIMYPRLTKRLYLDFAQTSFLGAIPITINGILVGIHLFYSDCPAAIWAAWSLWWIAVALSACTGIIVVLIVCAYQAPKELEAITGV